MPPLVKPSSGMWEGVAREVRQWAERYDYHLERMVSHLEFLNRQKFSRFHRHASIVWPANNGDLYPTIRFTPPLGYAWTIEGVILSGPVAALTAQTALEFLSSTDPVNCTAAYAFPISTADSANAISSSLYAPQESTYIPGGVDLLYQFSVTGTPNGKYSASLQVKEYKV